MGWWEEHLYFLQRACQSNCLREACRRELEIIWENPLASLESTKVFTRSLIDRLMNPASAARELRFRLEMVSAAIEERLVEKALQEGCIEEAILLLEASARLSLLALRTRDLWTHRA